MRVGQTDIETCVYRTVVIGSGCAGLNAADEEHIITSASASSIEFDPDLNAVFRRVTFHMAFCVCEEEWEDGLL